MRHPRFRGGFNDGTRSVNIDPMHFASVDAVSNERRSVHDDIRSMCHFRERCYVADVPRNDAHAEPLETLRIESMGITHEAANFMAAFAGNFAKASAYAARYSCRRDFHCPQRAMSCHLMDRFYTVRGGFAGNGRGNDEGRSSMVGNCDMRSPACGGIVEWRSRGAPKTLGRSEGIGGNDECLSLRVLTVDCGTRSIACSCAVEVLSLREFVGVIRSNPGIGVGLRDMTPPTPRKYSKASASS